MSLLHSLLNQSNAFLDPFISRINTDAASTGPIIMDWKETRDAHVFSFDLPGFMREEVKLEVHENAILQVTAERKEEEEGTEKGVKWHCKERVSDGFLFSRQFRLPENAKVDEIKASMRDGVLTVIVPKDVNYNKKKHKPKSLGVEVDGNGKDHPGASKGLSRFVCCKA